MKIDSKYKPLLLEALQDLMYKISLQQAKLKGQPLTRQRKSLTEKQNQIEELQHLVYTSE